MLFDFNTSVTDLTISQAALLAGLPKAPSIYSPINNLRLATKRRRIILAQMRQANIISPQEQLFANNEPILVKPRISPLSHAPFFVAYLKNILNSHPELTSGFSKIVAMATPL